MSAGHRLRGRRAAARAGGRLRLSTAYGSRPSPYSSRSTPCWARWRTGANAIATSAVATSAAAEPARPPEQHPERGHHGGVPDDQYHGQRRVDERAADHDLDAVEVSAQDGDATDSGSRGTAITRTTRVEARRASGTNKATARAAIGEREPGQLGALDALRATPAQCRGDDAADEADEEQHHPGRLARTTKTACGQGYAERVGRRWVVHQLPGWKALARNTSSTAARSDRPAASATAASAGRPSGKSSTPTVTSGIRPRPQIHSETHAAASAPGRPCAEALVGVGIHREGERTRQPADEEHPADRVPRESGQDERAERREA